MSEPIEGSPAQETQPERSLVARLGPAGLLGLVWAIAPAVAGILMLTYAATTAAWFKSFGDAGVWVYVGLFMVSAGLGLLPTYSQAVMGGFAFGVAAGLPAALAGFGGAALIGYEVARRASGDRVMGIIDEKPRYAAARDALVGGGFWKTLGIVTLLRVPFNSPFALTNLVLASVQVKRVPYVVGTLIGMAPRTALAVWIGHGMQELTGESLSMPKWVLVAGAVMMLVMLLVVSHVAHKAMAKVTNGGHRDDAERD